MSENLPLQKNQSENSSPPPKYELKELYPHVKPARVTKLIKESTFQQLVSYRRNRVVTSDVSFSQFPKRKEILFRKLLSQIGYTEDEIDAALLVNDGFMTQQIPVM